VRDFSPEWRKGQGKKRFVYQFFVIFTDILCATIFFIAGYI
jgi:hypothetical protein